MELIKGIDNEVKASFPASASGFSAQVKNAADVNVGAAINPVDEDEDTGGIQTNNTLVRFPIPHSVVVEEGKYKLVISYTVDSQPYTRTIHFHVATPYLDYWELREILTEEEGFTDDEVWKVERAARYIINVMCGQEFGYSYKTVRFIGESGTALSLPERLISIDKLDEGGNAIFDVDNDIGIGQFVITGTGWFLKRPSWANNSWTPDYDYYTSDPIVAPPIRGGRYTNDVEYSITGWFGYEEVPEAIKEAMKLLVNDYACAEQMYRDRFLESMKSADWRLQFNQGAYRKTGNARANVLLSPYVVNRMAVI